MIYQVPFTETAKLVEILKKLENEILDKAFFDIEMNSLEDAYINIAREEDRLLEELKIKGIRKI